MLSMVNYKWVYGFLKDSLEMEIMVVFGEENWEFRG